MEGGKTRELTFYVIFCPCCEMGEQARNALFAAMRNEPANRVALTGLKVIDHIPNPNN